MWVKSAEAAKVKAKFSTNRISWGNVENAWLKTFYFTTWNILRTRGLNVLIDHVEYLPSNILLHWGPVGRLCIRRCCPRYPLQSPWPQVKCPAKNPFKDGRNAILTVKPTCKNNSSGAPINRFLLYSSLDLQIFWKDIWPSRPPSLRPYSGVFRRSRPSIFA